MRQRPEPIIETMTCTELHQLLERGEPLRLVDVRTPFERELCTLEPSVLLDSEQTANAILADDDGTPVVFFCHHGNRSWSAAMWFAQRGLQRAINLEGGVDAWSQTVDPSMPRY